MKNSDGTNDEKSIVQGELGNFPSDWSSDGKYILYCRGPELWFVTFPALESRLFLKAPAVLRNGQFSPDGKWVAYASNETGKWEIYLTSFPDARGRWQVSSGGGEQPRWRGYGSVFRWPSPCHPVGLFRHSAHRRHLYCPWLHCVRCRTALNAEITESELRWHVREPISNCGMLPLSK